MRWQQVAIVLNRSMGYETWRRDQPYSTCTQFCGWCPSLATFSEPDSYLVVFQVFLGFVGRLTLKCVILRVHRVWTDSVLILWEVCGKKIKTITYVQKVFHSSQQIHPHSFDSFELALMSWEQNETLNATKQSLAPLLIDPAPQSAVDGSGKEEQFAGNCDTANPKCNNYGYKMMIKGMKRLKINRYSTHF